jgi:FtsP/CotA-like multicopper oxidase with cupredoxin domain
MNRTDLETTAHWHGLRHQNRFDGVPEGVHQGLQAPIPVGGSFTYQLQFPDPGVYWYHPHIREDFTQELGLYGNIIVIPKDPDYWAPVNREVALVLDDILVEDGKVAPFSRTASNRTAMGRYGNVLLVNGSDDYRLEVSRGEVLRLYLTNTANARPFNVRIPGAQLKLVGGDLGRVERECFIEEVFLAPADRVVVDALFERPGHLAIAHRTPDRAYVIGGVVVGEHPVHRSYAADFMTLRRAAELEALRERIDADFERAPDKTLRIVGEMPGMDRHGSHVDHGMAHHGAHDTHDLSHHDATREVPAIEWEDTMPEMNLASTPANTFWKLIDQETGRANHEIQWSFAVGEQIKIRMINQLDSDHPMQHPMHVHGQRFLVLTRDDVRNDNLVWSDTVLVMAGESVDLLLDASNPGAWMVHCHIAEHMESHMRFTFRVGEGNQTADAQTAGPHSHQPTLHREQRRS